MFDNYMLGEQFDNTPHPKKLSPFPSLERAEHHENESAEWFKFIQNTGDSLTPHEYNSAWGTMIRHDKYAENNRKRVNNPSYEPPKRCKTCDQPLGF